MKLITIFLIIFLSIIGIIKILSIINNKKYISLLESPSPISHIEMTIIETPYVQLPKRKTVSINDKSLLDSLRRYFMKNNVQIDKEPAKLNEIYVNLKMVKNGKIIPVDITKSVYVGWILEIGDKSYYNSKVFNLINDYLKDNF